ncbi:MAG: hypothetical protein AAF518_26190 [Spirochaetota bacterium]
MIYLEMFLKIGKYLSILLCILFVSCFEYEEELHLKRDFSGEVHINYVVPLKKYSLNSLIAFLPTQKKDIIEKINKSIFSKPIQIYDYHFEVIRSEEEKQQILKQRKKGRVSYKIKFNELSQLEGVLLGNLLVQQKKKSISIKRQFKSVLKPIRQTSSLGEKKIHSKTLKLLGDGYAKFKVYFPQNYECESNKGDSGLGYVYYTMPLVETIEKPGLKSWFFTIRNSE